jgi:hypothetical protein
MKVALDGNRIVVSAVVGLKDAKRLLKRLEANIALLEEEEGDAGEGRQLRRPFRLGEGVAQMVDEHTVVLRRTGRGRFTAIWNPK